MRVDRGAAGRATKRRLATDHVFEGDIRGKGDDRFFIGTNEPTARDRSIPGWVERPPMGEPALQDVRFTAKHGGEKTRQVIQRASLQLRRQSLE